MRFTTTVGVFGRTAADFARCELQNLTYAHLRKFVPTSPGSGRRARNLTQVVDSSAIVRKTGFALPRQATDLTAFSICLPAVSTKLSTALMRWHCGPRSGAVTRPASSRPVQSGAGGLVTTCYASAAAAGPRAGRSPVLGRASMLSCRSDRPRSRRSGVLQRPVIRRMAWLGQAVPDLTYAHFRNFAAGPTGNRDVSRLDLQPIVLLGFYSSPYLSAVTQALDLPSLRRPAHRHFHRVIHRIVPRLAATAGGGG